MSARRIEEIDLTKVTVAYIKPPTPELEAELRAELAVMLREKIDRLIQDTLYGNTPSTASSILEAFGRACATLRAADPYPESIYWLYPAEWDHWALKGWFILAPDGRVLANCPYEPAGVECRMIRPLPVTAR